ncbi:hypothetical protein Sjap_008088 [Stephania japonica]|uniref:Uncharacterized protein n=1 Tax=Stephania japonica TaxID=461633 RepID=A0AAP0JPH4_9MAGN
MSEFSHNIVFNSATCWDFIGSAASQRPFPPITRHKSRQSAISTNHAPRVMPISYFHQSRTTMYRASTSPTLSSTNELPTR